MYKIGETAEFDGVKRKVTGFSVINGVVYPNTEPYKEPEELKCRYCGKVYREAAWLEAHEEKCKENPKNKEVEE
jgi:hypothetical protein